jgi:sugar phosphate isomerase/epimerase
MTMRPAFSSLACPEWSVEEIVGAAVRYGFEGVEWRCADGDLLGPRTDASVWDRIASESRVHGIAAACLDTSCAFVTDDRARAIEDAALMAEHAASIGTDAIRVFAGRIPEGRTREEMIAPAAAALAEAAERARAFGVRVLVETHDEWSRAADAAALARAGNVGVLWDVLHTHRSGETPAASLQSCGAVSVVHLKDGTQTELTLLGEGEVPLDEIARVLAGTDGWLSFEWEKRWHPQLQAPEVALPHAAEVMHGLLLIGESTGTA